MRKQFFTASLIALSLGVFATPLPASAVELPIALPWTPVKGEVAATCAVPPAIPTGKTWYVDPINGSASGDGTAKHPWNSLQTVLNASASYAANPAWRLPSCQAASQSFNSRCLTGPLLSTLSWYHSDPAKGWVTLSNPNAPIKAGDKIILMSGDYGNVTIYGVYNPDFITIEAAPGATPVLGGLYLIGGGKWVFRGLTIENQKPNLEPKSGPNGDTALATFAGIHNDIIFDNNKLGTAFPVQGWTEAEFLQNWNQKDWKTLAAGGIADIGRGYNGGNCITITNNTIKNVGTGLFTQRSNHVLIKGNSVDYFDHDGFDYASNNLVIQNNILTNRLDAGDSTVVHPDFMQGQTWGCTAAGTNCDIISNVLIDSNIAIRQTDPDMPFTALSTNAGMTQGLDAFDGIWNNLRITNNIVITTAYQGISYYGVHGAVIANNILLNDGNSSTMAPWITVQHQKNGTVSSDVVIRNNIASGLNYDVKTTNASIDHNLCVPTGGKCNLQLDKYYAKPGTYGDHNVIGQNDASTLFNNLTINNGVVTAFDLHPKAGSLAVGTGNALDAPTIDIAGVTRTVPFDLGAYKHGVISGGTTPPLNGK